MKKKHIYTIAFSCFICILTACLTTAFLSHKPNNDDLIPSSDISDYNIENPVLIQYFEFNRLTDYINTTDEDYEILYFGYPTCPWCGNYTPIINDVMKSKSKPILYFNAKNLSDIIYDENGMAKNKDSYREILDWIVQNSIDAIGNEYIKYKETENSDGTTSNLLRLYVPRYFLIKDGKIVDCFMPSSTGTEALKGDSEIEKLVIKSIFESWLNERI